ncbi:DUF5994 family protein [Nocardioides sp. LHD-245]|uniref:DUF5994 family protein n=1 Tax=Nocardioides sp. LHD-245 TaxID=3051387 RepID=UPI0027DF4B14|nr:DUF5994 family protein [Nocardioides sp. LHD-245]
MAARNFPYPNRYPDALGALRLRLSEVQHVALADGIWLPYGRDLTREGAHLVDEFPADRGRIDRLVYAPGDWDLVAPEIFTRHGRVKVGFLPRSRGRGVVLLRLHTSEVLRIRIAWPGRPADPSSEPSADPSSEPSADPLAEWRPARSGGRSRPAELGVPPGGVKVDRSR